LLTQLQSPPRVAGPSLARFRERDAQGVDTARPGEGVQRWHVTCEAARQPGGDRMRRHPRFASVRTLVACSSLALAGCSHDNAPGAAVASASVTVTATAIPSDGQCAHIVVTRLADFQSTEYRGLLAGATLKALVGEDRVTATAYPTPCTNEPAQAPWTADAQTVTLVPGGNTVALHFHQSTDVTVDPNFDDTKPLVVRLGSQVRISRNGEDTAGPNFALDAWEVRQLSLPPAPVGETLLFSLEGKGVPYTPRGMAHLPDGSFVFQLAEANAPLYVFDGAGNNGARWAVQYPASAHVWDYTDGLEAIDATHLVRTGWANKPFNCDANGDHCQQSGIEILEKQAAPDGSTIAAVTRQILLPELPAEALNTEYPVGVAPVGARFAVAMLSDLGGTSLVLVNSDGSIAAGPVSHPESNDIEGLFDDGAGRLVGLDYNGTLTTYNDTDLSQRAESGNVGEGIGYQVPTRLVWRSAGAGSWVAYNGQRLVTAAPDFSSVSDLAFDLSNFSLLSGVDYRADTDEVLLMDRFPAGAPVVVAFNAATSMQTSSVTLQTGLSVSLRPWGLAYVASTHQLAAHYRRTSGSDATLDASVFVHNADGSLARRFDLGQYGFVRVQSVRYRADSDELVILAVDGTGATRIVTTDVLGNPHRSYRTDALPDLADVALIGSGPFAGDFGAVTGQPSYFARVALP
jgi:hypothetical protein